MYVLAAAAESLGHRSSSIVLNRESIWKPGDNNEKQLQGSFKHLLLQIFLLTIHLDGKMLPALESKESVDRLAVLLSGDVVIKLLGVPKLSNGTGEAEATLCLIWSKNGIWLTA